MDNTDIQAQVRGFITTNFYVSNPEALPAEASLLEQGIIDSTGILEVIGFIESTFGITVEDAELLPENLDSIHCISEFVARKQAAA